MTIIVSLIVTINAIGFLRNWWGIVEAYIVMFAIALIQLNDKVGFIPASLIAAIMGMIFVVIVYFLKKI